MNLLNISLWYAPLTGSRTPSVRDTDGDDLRSAGIHTDGDDDFFMTHQTDDFSD